MLRLPAHIGRHQVASGVATVVDFGVMIIAVSLAGLAPVVGTVLGATSGAVTNFTMGRHWTFQAAHAPASSQALRYAMVSGASLALNAGGEQVLAGTLGIQYVAARVVVALAVSLLWNYPLQRFFVFAGAPAGQVK